MKTKEIIEQELYESGLVDAIKEKFKNKNVNISEEYYVLIADYIDSLDKISDIMQVDVDEIANRLPQCIERIKDTNLNGAYGQTDKKEILMEQSLDYENKKLYFFHELTHALQTMDINGKEQCAFYDGHTGMFLTEGSTQYIAELLFAVSNDAELRNNQQRGRVRGDSTRMTNTPLSEYQYNGNILMLLSISMNAPIEKILSLSYKTNGREELKDLYESIDGNEGKFEELMLDLEKIYSIDKLIMFGHEKELNKTTLNLRMMDRTTTFEGNIVIYKRLMDKVEKNLLDSIINNKDKDYIVENQELISSFLTTQELKNEFLQYVNGIKKNKENNFDDIGNGLRGKVAIEYIKDDVTDGYHIENNGEYYTNSKGEEIYPLEGDIVTMAGNYGYVNQYGQIVKEQYLKEKNIEPKQYFIGTENGEAKNVSKEEYEKYVEEHPEWESLDIPTFFTPEQTKLEQDIKEESTKAYSEEKATNILREFNSHTNVPMATPIKKKWREIIAQKVKELAQKGKDTIDNMFR